MVTDKQLANLKPELFSSTNQPTKRRGPSVLTPLKRLLQKNITYEDPETKQMVKGKIQDVIALRHILNATTGDHNAIKDILDRIDGKEQAVEVNLYIQMWQGAINKAKEIDERGRVIGIKT
jgi:hypothetical protein